MVIDEVHNRSAHSDYVLALTLAAMQKKPTLRLVLMSATGDHNLVRERLPHCQQLVMKGVMHKVRRCFLEQPLDRSACLLNQIAQMTITYHNERVGRPLIDETCHCKGVSEFRSAEESFHRCKNRCYSKRTPNLVKSTVATAT